MARQEKKIHYLYKTTCLVTNRYYIGMHSTSNLDDGYMGSGKRLRASLRKHGVDNHKKEIIKFFETRELLIEAEKEAITTDMIIDKNCMNLMGGGQGGFISEEHTEKMKLGASKWMTKKWCDETFKIESAKRASDRMIQHHENGKINYNTFDGKQHSDETKKIMSDKAKERIGDKNSQYGTCWITKDGLNKKIKKENLGEEMKQGWVKGRK